MFCAKCGKEIPNHDRFCQFCGTPVDNSESKQEKAVVKPAIKVQTPQKERKPFRIHINKALIVSLIEVLLLVGLVFGFLKVGDYLYGPTSVAKEYMQAYYEDDFDKIYAMSEREESFFLTDEALKKALEKKLSGDFEDYEVASVSERGRSAVVKVKYGKEGSLKNKIELTLNKQDEKGFFIFDTWKVSLEDIIIDNYEVRVPKSTDAYFDGILIPAEYKQERFDTDNMYGGYDVYDSYILPQVYSGEYTITAAIDDYPVYSEKINIDTETAEMTYEGNGFRLYCPEKMQDEIVNVAYDYMNKYEDALITGKNFNEIEDMFVHDKDILDNAKSTYEYSGDRYYVTNKNYGGIKDLKIKKIVGEMNQFYQGERGISSDINIEFEFKRTTKYKSYYGDDEERTDENYSDGNCYASLVYGSDGTWKLTGLNLGI